MSSTIFSNEYIVKPILQDWGRDNIIINRLVNRPMDGRIQECQTCVYNLSPDDDIIHLQYISSVKLPSSTLLGRSLVDQAPLCLVQPHLLLCVTSLNNNNCYKKISSLEMSYSPFQCAWHDLKHLHQSLLLIYS